MMMDEEEEEEEGRDRDPLEELPVVVVEEEDQSDDDDARTNEGCRRPQPTKSYVIARYVLLSTVAVGMALACPGTTKTSTTTTDRATTVIKLAAIYVLTLTAFFALVGSDPGYLTPEIMQAFGRHVDGRTLLGDIEGEETTNDDDDEEQQQQPRGNPDEEETEPLRLRRTRTMSMSNDDDGSKNKNKTSDSEAASMYYYKGGKTRRPACQQCQFAPPLRSHHCRVCDKHVATFDHHCEFVGTCIGERNHARFWWFLTTQLVGFYTCCAVVNTSQYGFTTLLFSSRSHSPHDSSNSESPETILYASLFVMIAKLYLYPLASAAFLIWIIHTFFALTNLTTFECTKGSQHLEYLRGTDVTDLPFSSSRPWVNVLQFCCHKDAMCRRRPPSSRVVFQQQQQQEGVATTSSSSSFLWTPIAWQPPKRIVRDSEDWWNHPWQNKYWSCC